MDLASYIRDIPDFPKPGIVFKDITPLLADPAAFAEAIKQLVDHYRDQPVDAVAAAEARGFLFAAPMALIMQRPLIPLRKPGKLPHRTYSLKYELEYGTAELQVHIDGVGAGIRFLAPQLDRDVFRIDLGFPVPPDAERGEISVMATFGQAFGVPQ